MKNDPEISDEAFRAKETEIAKLFARKLALTNLTEDSEEGDTDAASKERIERILSRARQTPTAEGRARIGKIIDRLKTGPEAQSTR
ncbi:MAG: hypothetical protein KDN19_22295 [Verrucomicrobiae bacterium]|nr:hypothetical protein [Verrucomicrobiae bacterium]